MFGAKVFVSVVRRYGLEQEYITPYSPEQNGMIERFFLTLKQECVWLQRFEDRDHAFRVVADWLDRYHTERPHSALGYLTPKEYRERISGLTCTETRGTPQVSAPAAGFGGGRTSAIRSPSSLLGSHRGGRMARFCPTFPD